MPKMTIRVILKSGSEFAIKCDKFTIQQNGFGQATGYNIEGITENKPVYLDFVQGAAVVRVYSVVKEAGGGQKGASIFKENGLVYAARLLRPSERRIRLRA